jgi:hypothetical protein
MSIVKWPVYKVKCTYKTYKHRDVQSYPPPDESDTAGKTALMPAHEEPIFGGCHIREPTAACAHPTIVRIPSVRSTHAIIETVTDSIIEDHHIVQESQQRLACFYAPRKAGFRSGHVEKLGNFEIHRSNAVRRKPMLQKPVAQRQNPDVQCSVRPFSYILTTEPTSCMIKVASSQGRQLKRTGAVRGKKAPRYCERKTQEAPSALPTR